MTAKEKAKELVEKYWEYIGTRWISEKAHDKQRGDAKQCALIAVDEAIFAICGRTKICNSKSGLFYKEVKEEIKKL